MTLRFVHEGRPGRVVFGIGAADRLADEIERAGLRRLLVVCTPPQADLARRLAEPVGEWVVGLHPHAEMHVPVATAEKAVERATELSADGCLAVGGGSAVGLAKAVAKETGLPIVAVPTTYAGSEMTSVWGLTDRGGKTTGRDARVLPALVIYDPALTVTLPVAVAVTSGFNALAHAAEALYAPDASPITSLIARESVRALVAALPRVAADPHDVDSRAEALYGAWLAGSVLGSTTMSLHHKLCHVLGGTFDLGHAEVHTAVLPHVLAANLPAAAPARTALQEALGVEDPAAHLFDTARRLGADMALERLGMPMDGVDVVVERVLAAPYANPVPVTGVLLRHLLGNALTGAVPSPPPDRRSDAQTP
ncbi:maleylacetate reductase [Pseudonocardia sp. WMMC193]|uniref:maleylacetate reductase n=1 Tax=Pseudonocardia sp. WMMC193 TaxID=2911965 RepID=UPI001F268E04|nr:maleylacetate reductase [Pseudonocardia sp. WMMC193]MCF7550664.1 maleylacetate reductase [Pseudonocardia sp. WMMC193]